MQERLVVLRVMFTFLTMFGFAGGLALAASYLNQVNLKSKRGPRHWPLASPALPAEAK